MQVVSTVEPCVKSMTADYQEKSKFEPEFLGLQNADNYHLLLRNIRDSPKVEGLAIKYPENLDGPHETR